jgi:hypothetical protein
MAEKSDAESFLERIVDLEYEIKKLNHQLRYQKKGSRYAPETEDAIKKMIDFKKQRIAQLEKDLLILIKNKHD